MPRSTGQRYYLGCVESCCVGHLLLADRGIVEHFPSDGASVHISCANTVGAV